MPERKVVTFFEWKLVARRRSLRTSVGSDIQVPIIPDLIEIDWIGIMLDKQDGELKAVLGGIMKDTVDAKRKLTARLQPLVNNGTFTKIEKLTYSHPPSELCHVGEIIMPFRTRLDEDATQGAFRCLDAFLIALGTARNFSQLDPPYSYQRHWVKRGEDWVTYAEDAVRKYLARVGSLITSETQNGEVRR